MRLLLICLVCLVAAGLTGCASLAKTPLLEAIATPESSPVPPADQRTVTAPTAIPISTPAQAEPIEAGEQALINGDWDAALAEFQAERDTNQDPKVQAAVHLGIGRTHLLAGQYDLAVQEFESFISRYPESSDLPRALVFLAQASIALERHADATQAYTQYLALRPGIADGYILELRGDAYFAGGDFSNAAQDYAAAVQQPSLLDTTYLKMKRARSLALGGDSSAALALYDEIYSQTTNDYTKALIDLRQGQILTTLGLADQANAAYLDAVNNYPASYDSYSALLALVEAGIPVDDLQRGLVDYYAGEYGVSLAAFNRYLQNNPVDPGAARYYSGLANQALGGYSEALNEWDKLINEYPEHRFWADAWEQKAYTLWYHLEQYPEAIQTLLNFSEQEIEHPRAPEFLYEAALISERAGELGQAAEFFERVVNFYPGFEQAQRALFLSGIARYRMGDYPGSYLVFQRQLGSAGDIGEMAQAYYWTGKNLQKMGDEAGARAAWLQAADIDPTGYYSERARDLLSGQAPFTPPVAYDLAFDRQAERQRADEWMRSTFALPENYDLNGLGELAGDPRWSRGLELWNLGLFDQARAEFEDLRQAVTADPVQTYRLANAFAELGLYRLATLAARQVLNLAGMSDADTLNAPPYFNRLRFGTYFSDLIIPAAEQYEFHPLLIFSLVRQESLFESFVRSSASAQGLMQIMPATGAEIAQKLDWPENYKQGDLTRPLVNVNFGTSYLAGQRELFEGDLYAALAAYNGGPGNAAKWLELAQDDPDLFLEVIRFGETRDYIRRIYEIFNIYRRLYDRSP